MDITERQNYEKMFVTFDTEGWRLLRERFIEMFNTSNNLFVISDEKAFWQTRGSLGMLQFFIELEDIVKNELEQAEKDETEDNEDIE
tara:strand:+ start:769 stop:1029 length:261 start_codon:yes stop_codon:yes gene_type:complete